MFAVILCACLNPFDIVLLFPLAIDTLIRLNERGVGKAIKESELCRDVCSWRIPSGVTQTVVFSVCSPDSFFARVLIDGAVWPGSGPAISVELLGEMAVGIEIGIIKPVYLFSAYPVMGSFA